jgi:methionine-rich copper-binding protein CopC
MGFIHKTITVAVLSAILAFAPRLGLAHAVLIEAVPKPGSVVTASEVDVRLRFNARIDHERSSLTLIGPNGESPIDTTKATAPADVMAGRLSGLAPGKYRLRWQVLAVDGHITRGDVQFEVRTP